MQASFEPAPGATAAAVSDRAGRRALLLVVLAATGLALYQYASLFGFVIDDAYIVLHYARNLVTRGELVFNPGERVSALTSPLHALITAGLYAVLGERTLLAYKLICCACVAVGGWLTFRAQPDRDRSLPVTLVMLVAAPSAALWTFGGLETPLLFLVVAVFAAKLVRDLREGAPLTRSSIVQLHLLAAAAFLLRHDSVCFFAPALLMVWGYRSDWASVAIAVALAALPCLAWFGFAWSYYGDLLPTSFYVKTPGFGLRGLVSTGLYELMWLTLMGFVPVLVAAAISRSRGNDWRFDRAELVLLAGLAATWIYGLSMAQKHMMFGFRHGMPYLPAATAVVLTEVRRWTLRPPSLAALLLVVLIADAAHTKRMLDVSVNGYWKSTAYSEADARSLMRMVDVWKGTAEDIRAHWQALNPSRSPRVFTYAGGVMPYALPEAYIFEELVSARRLHCMNAQGIAAAADYIHAVSTPQTRTSHYYSAIASHPGLQLISDRPIEVGGELRRVQVYYNPSPERLQLPARFNDPCPEARSGAQRSYFYQWLSLMRGSVPLDKMSHRELVQATEWPDFDRDLHAQPQTAPHPFLASAGRAADAAAGAGVHRPEHGRDDLPDPRADPRDDHVGLAVPEGPDQGRLVPRQAHDLPAARRAARRQQRRDLTPAVPPEPAGPRIAACSAVPGPA